MRIAVTCPGCRLAFTATDDEVVLGVRCRKCGGTFFPELPARDEVLNVEPVEEEVLDVVAADDIPVVALADDAERPYRPRTAARRRQEQQRHDESAECEPSLTNQVVGWGGKKIVKLIVGKVLFLLFIMPCGGGFLLVWQAMDGALLGGGNFTPQVLSCKDLIEKGPGDNGHVVLTDFRLNDDAVAKHQSFWQDTTWKKAWVQAVPADSPPGKQPVLVLVELDDKKTMTDVQKLQRAGRIQGVLRRDLPRFQSDEADVLKKAYPGTDFTNCWFLQQGTTPAWNFFLTVLAIVMIVVGLLIWVGFGWLVYLALKERAAEQSAGAK